ncbi:hypothetical protein DDZ14_13030 [Maritimibacter sp. 55A14]|uniref:Hpt domain-containing protein n=1 Tax=Maritimibacter sp. 55A14 TaxID=2174844 RepID=UPI000D62260E|nr:Hpt domain-containing protein [Maritimibacter sp. 55A14]PWE31430.1 hypothetical protein DDZ14_13030 [Maritimibacter sp. 55A14]
MQSFGATAKEDELSRAILQVRARFVETLDTQILEIEELRKSASQPESRETALRGIRERAHRLVGYAATIGFEPIGDRAREVDSYVDEWLSAGAPAGMTAEIDDLIERLLCEMEAALPPGDQT